MPKQHNDQPFIIGTAGGVIGPFATAEDAHLYARTNYKLGEYWVVQVTRPKGDDASRGAKPIYEYRP